MASQYKNLFFDLDDTLWAFSLNARDTFEEMYHKYDYDRFFRSFQHFYTLYQHRNVELWEEYGRGQVSKEELNRQRFLYPLEAVGAGDAALAEAFSDDFFSVIPTKSQLMPHAYEVLDIWRGNITSISFPTASRSCNVIRCVRQALTTFLRRLFSLMTSVS